MIEIKQLRGEMERAGPAAVCTQRVRHTCGMGAALETGAWSDTSQQDVRGSSTHTCASRMISHVRSAAVTMACFEQNGVVCYFSS